MRAFPMLAIAVASSLALANAAAEEVRLTVHGEVSLHPEKIGSSLPAHSCKGECTFAIAPGTYTFVSADVEETVLVDGPTTVTYKRGRPSLRAVGGAIFGVGALIAVLATYGALSVCSSTTTRTADTQVIDRPCKDGEGATRHQNVQYVLLGTAGVGFTGAVLGGFIFFAAGPSLSFDSRTQDSSGLPVAAIVPLPGGAAFSLAGTF